MAKPKLSLCMIVRNEERMLPACLESVRGAVDEIVLVDTGSGDRTRELARAAGARVLERAWDDDFAAPRNLAAERATGGWILQLDADERLAPGAGAAIRAAIRRGEFDVGFVRLHNASRIDASVADVLGGALRHGQPTLLPRVLRRAPDLRYLGAIHECVSEWAAARGNRLERIAADVVHLGYVPDVHASRDKRNRNLALLRRRVEQEPDNVVPLSYVAAELFTAGDFDGAAEVAERGWAMLDSQPRHRPIRRLAVSRAAAAVHRNELAKVHESVDRSERHEGPNPDYDYLRGCAWETEGTRLSPDDPRRGELLRGAAGAYRRVLADVRKGGFVQVMLSGVPDALTRLGSTLLKLGDWAGAQEAFAEARAEGAGDGVRLGEAEARIASGDPAGGLKLLQPVMERYPEAWALAARAAQALGARDDARLFVSRARALAEAQRTGAVPK
jgi:glycosyltransferase involved in cell wall biosynthesis